MEDAVEELKVNSTWQNPFLPVGVAAEAEEYLVIQLEDGR